MTGAALSANISFAPAGDTPSPSIPQPPWEEMFAGFYPEAQFELQILNSGCDILFGTSQRATDLLKSDDDRGRVCGSATWSEPAGNQTAGNAISGSPTRRLGAR